MAVFQYSIPDGRKESAVVDDTWWDQVTWYNSSHDPYWITSASPDKQVWLGYTAHDNRLWFSRVSATHWHQSAIKLTFEHRGPVPDGWQGDPKSLPKNNNDADNGHLGYIDWEGNRRYLVLGDVNVDPGERNKARPELKIEAA